MTFPNVIFPRRPAVVALLLVVACGGAPASEPVAKETVPAPLETEVIERAPDCSQCTLVMTEVGTVGQAADSFSIQAASTVALLPPGRFVVGPTTTNNEAISFDSVGAAPRRLGRAGQGPGEIWDVLVVLPWGADSVILYGTQRLTVLDVAAGTGRTATYPRSISGFDILAIPDRSVLIASSTSPLSAQFVTVDADGKVQHEFGVPKPASLRFDADARAMVLGPATLPGAFWAGSKRYRYRLEQWDLGGTRLRTIDRSPAWFTPSDSTSTAALWRSGPGTVRPFPTMRSVRETAQGTLMSLFTVAAKGWKADQSAGTPQGPRGGEQGPVQRTRPELYDGIIEVLDSRTGKLLISERTNRPLRGFLNDTLAYEQREIADGGRQLVLYRVQLLRN